MCQLHICRQGECPVPEIGQGFTLFGRAASVDASWDASTHGWRPRAAFGRRRSVNFPFPFEIPFEILAPMPEATLCWAVMRKYDHAVEVHVAMKIGLEMWIDAREVFLFRCGEATDRWTFVVTRATLEALDWERSKTLRGIFESHRAEIYEVARRRKASGDPKLQQNITSEEISQAVQEI